MTLDALARFHGGKGTHAVPERQGYTSAARP